MLKSNINKIISKFTGVKADYSTSLDSLVPAWRKLDDYNGESPLMVSILFSHVGVGNYEDFEVDHRTDEYCDIVNAVAIATAKAIECISAR